MSETQTGIAAGASASIGNVPVRAAIARAARDTGMDFQYMLAQAKIESAPDPQARARTSSATGLYQFTRDTWLRTLEAHGGKHGLGWASAAISNGRITDPALAGQIMALRTDPQASALMAGELASDNHDALTGVLGREPDAAELYLGHFLGSGGAGRFLTVLGQSPDASAAAILPKAAGANRAIFYHASGAARSVGEVMDLIRGKVEAAKEPAASPDDLVSVGSWASLAPSQRTTSQPTQSQPLSPTWQEQARAPFQGRSMAETLRNTFAAVSPGGTGQPPAAVAAAYARLARFGL